MSNDGGRQYAQILKRIWSDPDWKALGRDAQWLYQMLISQPSMNYAGVLPLTVRRWSHLAERTTVDEIEAALEELSRARFVLVDRETEELLVRTFIRNDGLWKQPRMLEMALRHTLEIESIVLRSVASDELKLLPTDRPLPRVIEVINELVAGHEPPPAPPPAPGHREGVQEGVQTSSGVGGYVSTVGGAPAPSPFTVATFNATGKGSCSPAAPPSEYPAAFEEFWQHYPRKAGKRKAFAAWKRARTRATDRELLDGADRHAQDPNREDQFTKYAEGWLNGDGWLDEPLPSRNGHAKPDPTQRAQAILDMGRELLAEQPKEIQS